MDLHHPTERRSLPAIATHASTTELLWERGEPAFPATVANIIVHELGHTIGGLNHHRDLSNFMFSGGSIDRVLGPGFRTRPNLRRLWSGPHEFVRFQRLRLIGAIRARELRGFEVADLRTAP